MARQVVHGIPEAVANLKKYQIIKTQAIKDRLKKQGFKIELAAKEIATEKGVVDTGRLRASISTNWAGSSTPRASIKNPIRDPRNPSKSDDGVGRPDGPKELVYVVGTNVKYAPAQEHGTSKLTGRPYLYPAYFMYEGETIRAIALIMKKDVKL